MDLEPKKILKWYQKLPLEEKEKVFFQLEEIYHALHGELKSHYFKEHHYELRILHNSVFLEVSAVNTSLNIH